MRCRKREREGLLEGTEETMTHYSAIFPSHVTFSTSFLPFSVSP